MALDGRIRSALMLIECSTPGNLQNCPEQAITVGFAFTNKTGMFGHVDIAMLVDGLREKLPPTIHIEGMALRD